MGSSFAGDLKAGMMEEWEDKLREAIKLISEVRIDVSRKEDEETQFDNAAETGGLWERLYIVTSLLEYTLPKKQ